MHSKKENEPLKEMTELMKDCVDRLSKFRPHNNRMGKNNRNPFNVKNKECYECHQLGHLSYDCPKKTSDKINEKELQKSQNKEN